MKRILSLSLTVLIVLLSLIVPVSAAIKESAAVGDIVYMRYTDKEPNMDPGIIDDSWGEKLITVTSKTKNSGIYVNTWEYSNPTPEMNTYCDIYCQFDNENRCCAFVTNDPTPLGSEGGDSVCLILEANNPSLTYICKTDPETGDRHTYITAGAHLSGDDYTLEDYGENEEREVTWVEKRGVITIKYNVPFSHLSLKESDLENGVVVNFCFMRNILSNPDHFHSGDGQMYWGKYFTLLTGEPYYCRDNKNAKGPNSFIIKKTNSKQLLTEKLMTEAEYNKYMGVSVTPSTPVHDPKKSDEKPSSWAETEVNAAIKAGLVPVDLQKNYTKGITRQDLSKMLSLLIDITYGKTPMKNDAKFTDTTDPSVLKAANLGIINGYKQNDGSYAFKPANTLKRSEMSAIINRVAKLCGKTTTGFDKEVKFTDTVNHWCMSELGYPVHMGIVKGTSATMFSPENTLTVEQTIMMLYRTYTALK